MQGSRFAVAALAVVGLLSGCGGESVQVGAAEPPEPSASHAGTSTPVLDCGKHPDPSKCPPQWTPAPAEPGENVYPKLGVRTVPAPRDAEPRITRGEAIQMAKDTHEVSDAKAPLDVDLRLWSDGDWAPGSPIEQKYDHRLTWVIIDHHAEVYISPWHAMPGHPPTDESLVQPAEDCDATIAIEANSGDVIDDSQVCPGTPDPTETVTAQPKNTSASE